MNRISFSIFLLTLFAACSKPESAHDHQLKFVIKKAKKFNDYNTAIGVTYELISTDTNELSYYDSLAAYYLKSGNFFSSLKVAKHVLGYKTTDHLLETGITSAITLKEIDDVILFGKSLVKRHPNSAKWSYELAKAYFNSNKGYEAQAELLKLIELKEAKVEVTSTVISNKTYQIPYYSAAQNLLGVLYANEGRLVDAKKHFQESLRFTPDFLLPAENIALIEQQQPTSN